MVSYSRDAAGQVSAVTLAINGAATPLASGIAYLPFGPLTAMTLGNFIVG